MKKMILPSSKRGNEIKNRGEHLAPPLQAASKSSMLVAMHLLRGRKANLSKKVAWVTSGAPVEVLRAMDFYTHYPENHGAICGIALQTQAISTEAEKRGYSTDLCSYARTDIGSFLSGITPIKSIPKPDLLMACTNICQTVLHWYRVLAFHFNVPLILIDTPFLYDYAPNHAIAYVKRQIEDAVPQIEAVAGKPLDLSALQRVTELSQCALRLWRNILECCQYRPAPLTAFDQFVLMAPIVELRGEEATVDLYTKMLQEVKARVANGVGAVQHESRRLLWDNLPIWYELPALSEFLAARGIALVTSTYTNAWGELADMLDPKDPFGSAALAHLNPLLNRSTGDKLRQILQMVSQYQLDGVILHSDRSCKPYSIGQMDQRDLLVNQHHIPALLLEADHCDPRSYAREQVTNRLEAFCEILGVDK